MNRKLLTLLTTGIMSTTLFAAQVDFITPQSNPKEISLYKRSGFFRFSFDNLSMPNNIDHMGLLGLTYYADLTPSIYAGMGGYGSITGSQGGLFVLGLGAGVHHQFVNHWWGDLGLFAGGGGGRSSLVGGGLMLKPYMGIAYDWKWARLGLHYSYVTFPSGFIRSKQIGLDLDFPFDFYYTDSSSLSTCTISADNISLLNDLFLNVSRNDFAIILQAYGQLPGTRNVNNEIQDGTIGIVGAELDHYITDRWFWWVQTGGAFRGIPNGFMDVLGGAGYHAPLNKYGIAIVPQLGIGAGGGGNVDTGGGVLVHPLLGFEIPIHRKFSVRISGGYLWAPAGKLRAYSATGALIYHLDVAQASLTPAVNLAREFWSQGWRIHIFNQTYLHPQRANWPTNEAINLIAVQFDQSITPNIFLSYQAASAYQGAHAGGYASGMVGAGLQSNYFFRNSTALYAEFLIGAGGGGNLALAGGAIIEPVVGIHYAFNSAIGATASVSQLKALNHNLNTPAVNLGITIRFGTLNAA